jgi:hypothetical protein
MERLVQPAYNCATAGCWCIVWGGADGIMMS